jgi:hypothetical protein
MTESEQPFLELPEALVEEMLGESDNLGKVLGESFKKINSEKKEIRDKLFKKGFLKNEADIIKAQAYPTTCGIDGSYEVNRLLATDIAAVAGIAIEGLVPPKETKYWERPRHLSKMVTLAHDDSTELVARAIMMTMELELSTKAPHDVVFMDGSLTTPLIYLNQALNRINSSKTALSEFLKSRLESALNSYQEVTDSPKSDKIYAALPKYTSRKEVSTAVGLSGYEDRGLLSFVLNPSEIVGPFKLEQPTEKWHIDNPLTFRPKFNKIIDSLGDIYVFYYRPFAHSATLRIETSKSVANNNQRLSVLVEALKSQCVSAGMMEPYPLYLADRMVKHLGKALPAIVNTITQQISFSWEDDISNIYLAMHGYRTK